MLSGKLPGKLSGKLVGFVFASIVVHGLVLLFNAPNRESQVSPAFTDTALYVQFFNAPQAVQQRAVTSNTRINERTVKPPTPTTQARQQETPTNKPVQLSRSQDQAVPDVTPSSRAIDMAAKPDETPAAPPSVGPENSSPEAATVTNLEVQHLAQQRRATLQQVQHLLSSQFHYPRRARQFGWEGKVLVGFHVSAQGKVANVYLARSSGYALLDQSAMDAVAGLKTISRPEAPHRWQDMDLELPVIYQLQKG